MKKKIMAGIISAVMMFSSVPNIFADDINELYDEVKFINTCDTSADGVTLNDGSPDGSGFYTTGGKQYTSIGGLSANTSEDYIWEADIRFDAVSSGFTVMGGKVGTCIRRYDESDGTSKLAVQTGSTAYVKYDTIDTDKWYNIQLIGQFGTSEPMKMEVYKWENGKKVFVSEYDNINKRQNQPARYIAIEANTSVDNVKITKPGADELTLSTLPENTQKINAGASVNMQFEASRKERAINKPQVEWKLFEDGKEIADGSVMISASGVLTASKDCGDKIVTVKAISTEKGNVEGEYRIEIKSVDFENAKYDSLFLSAETVREGQPLSLTVSATKNGEKVGLVEGDVVWSFYDESNVQEIGNKYISVKENILYVTDKVISQNIVVRAESTDKAVSASLPVRIKAADAVEADEQGNGDIVLIDDAGEDISNGAIVSGSWDGSHYYNIENTYDMASVASTNEDVIIEADIKFIEENSGIKLRNNGNSKEGGQIARQGDKIGRIGSGSKFLAFSNGDADSWYHIMIITRCGADNSYGKAYIYKYNENGDRVNPDDGMIGKAAEGVLDLRTMASQYFNHLQVQSGTAIDNMRIMKLVPDSISVTLPTDTVFAGNSAQASVSVSRKGEEIQAYPSANIIWAVYDAEDKYPIDTDLITVDSSGLVAIDATASEQTVYIRATLDGTDIYCSQPLNIKGSDIFAVTGFGTNEDGTAVKELKVEKNFFYNGDVVFIVAVYDRNGALIDVAVRNMRDNTLPIGENKISIDEIEITEDFAEIKAMVWTSLV